MGDGAITGFTVVDLEGGDQRVVLIDSADVTINPQSHQDLDDIDASLVATATLSGESVALSAGTLTYDASDATFSAVTGDQAEQLVIYEHTGTPSTSPCIVFFDTFTSGMPVTPNGGDIVVQWHASGIFTW